MAGQINRSVLNRPELGRREIEQAARLTRYDPTVSLVQGLLAVDENRWADAQAALTRFTLLGGSPREFTDLLLHKGHVDIPYAIARGNRAALQYLVSRMPANDPAWSAWITRCQSDINQLLAQQTAGPDASAGDLVELAETEVRARRVADAIGLYQRALRAEYGQVAWHLRLSHLLYDTARYTDAAREARVALEIRPQSSEAQTLLRQAAAKAERK